MVIVIPPNHVDDVPVIEPNQHDDVLEPVLVDEDEDPKEEEFEDINFLFGRMGSLSKTTAWSQDGKCIRREERKRKKTSIM
nr:hypothetical protein [Tanacetum cinerariifolium]